MESLTKLGMAAAVLAGLFSACAREEQKPVVVAPTDDPSQFVNLGDIVPDAVYELRYYSSYNCTGQRLNGYFECAALLTRQAAESLKGVSDELMQLGYRLKVYDAYRPQCAQDHIIRWAKDLENKTMKERFFPDIEDKTQLFDDFYVLDLDSHTRGSSVDVTLFDVNTGQDVDMGTTFDWAGPESHLDFCGNPETGKYTGDNSKSPRKLKITEQQFTNRMILRQAMMNHGFQPRDNEWWHYTLANEPFPDTYFFFPVHHLGNNEEVPMPNQPSQPAAQ